MLNTLPGVINFEIVWNARRRSSFITQASRRKHASPMQATYS
jgi:hypothetical protein